MRSRAELPPLTRLVLEELIDRYSDKHGCAWPSLAFLAARLGCGMTQIKGAIRAASGAGLIGIRKSGRPTARGYRHNVYMIDLELMAARDPDRGGYTDSTSNDLGTADTVRPRAAATVGIPTNHSRNTDGTTVGKPTT